MGDISQVQRCAAGEGKEEIGKVRIENRSAFDTAKHFKYEKGGRI